MSTKQLAQKVNSETTAKRKSLPLRKQPSGTSKVTNGKVTGKVRPQ